MNVVFRVDASLQIGTGHVMRCVTLANALSANGANCQFMCRSHEGHLIEFIRGKGYTTHTLPTIHIADVGNAELDTDLPGTGPTHKNWLGATQMQDAEACAPILATQRPDWLIVDHYALDALWESALVAHFHKLMVIDDLADRPHACDLLLDQTFGRKTSDYRHLVADTCRLLCGAQYALLRPEFAALRAYSLQRRARPVLRDLLITMGGVDKDNATVHVMRALHTCPLPANTRLTVVMGATAPWLDDVLHQAREMPWPTQVLVGATNMAQLMADSDLAIGAAGATSWERCCLGLPTIMFVLADNQLKVARCLELAGAAMLIHPVYHLTKQITDFLAPLIHTPEQLRNISESARLVVDGTGVSEVLLPMEA